MNDRPTPFIPYRNCQIKRQNTSIHDIFKRISQRIHDHLVRYVVHILYRREVFEIRDSRNHGFMLCALLIVLCLFLFPRHTLAPTPVTNAEDLGLLLQENADGLYVIAVLDPSPASRCGFRPGDVILSFNQSNVLSLDRFDAMLASQSGATGYGEQIHITVLRDNNLVQLILPADITSTTFPFF